MYENIKHNIYQKKILNPNYCIDVVNLASKFLSKDGDFSLIRLFDKFKQRLALKVKSSDGFTKSIHNANNNKLLDFTT